MGKQPIKKSNYR